MAQLERLVAEVPNEELRNAIAAEVADLKKRTRFGLVYERHIPEVAVLGSVPIEEGNTVVLRRDQMKTFRVRQVDGVVATVLDAAGEEEHQVDVGDLLVVKGFGEPIFPTLTPLERVEQGGPRPFHAVIDAENWHCLQLLVHLYEGQVDCIYIDPPYNTGARDWKYNNRFVDSSDAWRHSKWLSFMEKRLRLAKQLLKSDGILIVTIDEHEVHHLGMLLESIFPEYLRYMVTDVISAQGNDKVNFSRVEEHIFFCVPDTGEELIHGALIDFLPAPDELHVDPDAAEEEVELVDETDAAAEGDPTEEFMVELARRRGKDSLRVDRPNMFYPIYIDETARKVVRAGPPVSLDEEPDFSLVDGLRPVWPIDSRGDHRRWRWNHDTMNRSIEKGEMELGQYNRKRDSWTINRVQPRQQTFRKLKTVWRHTSHAAGTHGSGLLERFLGRGQAFAFPKSVYATRDSLSAVCRDRPDALIVDFFGGSGTTLRS